MSVTYGMLRRPTDMSRIKGPSQPNLSARMVRKPSFGNVQGAVSSAKPDPDAWMRRAAPADGPAQAASYGGGMRRRMAAMR
jgi:hypothetical protein